MPSDFECAESVAFKRVSVSLRQLTLSLVDEGYTENINTLLASLSRLTKGTLKGSFFFVLKGLEVRIRFPGSRCSTPPAEWNKWCRWLLDQKLITASRWSRYFPEIFQFGGPAVYKIVLGHFSAESSIIATHHDLFYSKSEDDIGRKMDLMTIYIADLFIRITDDTWEAWDCVARLAYVRGMLGDLEKKTISRLSENSSILSRWANSPSEMFLDYPAGYHDCYVSLSKTNRRTAALVKQGICDINFGVRNLGVVFALYALNRVLLNVSQQRKMVQTLSVGLKPIKHIDSLSSL